MPRLLRISREVCAALLAACTLASDAGAVGADRSYVVLGAVSEIDVDQYARLFDLARKPRVEILKLTNSEAWLIAKPYDEAVVREAANFNIKITAISDDQDHLFKEFRIAPVLSPVQQNILAITKQSHRVLNMSIYRCPDPSVVEFALVRRHISGEISGLFAFSIPMAGGVSVRVARVSVKLIKGAYVWHGLVVSTREPVMLVWNPHSGLAGSIRFNGRTFAIRPMGSSTHGIVEFDAKVMPSEHGLVAPDLKRKMDLDPWASVRGHSPSKPVSEHTKPGIVGSQRRIEDKKSNVAISIIVAYTKKASRHYNDIVHDLIAVALEETNQSFVNSGINSVRLELAYSYEVDYVETGTHFDNLFRFVYDHDGDMDEIHELRKLHRGNLAVLIVDDPNGCGLSASVSATSDRAFSVVHHECAAANYSLGHEVGHLLGARHEPDLDDSKTPFFFGHGFVSAQKDWRDIMSYGESCDGCPRLPIWSNPDVIIDGAPAGDEARNNAKVILERASIVAGY